MPKIKIKITPGPGTFKPYGFYILLPIIILWLDFKIFPSYYPGPGTLFISYFNLFSLPKLYPLFVVTNFL